ncbi:MAG: DNA polymerase IV [Candidatus Sumerlaeota bacterium]|nr:DNA polymerase IV [Candidatus Sumerlaeota bacterium]
MAQRPPTILHADLDAFFAAVEQLDRPEWRGRPVIVGGLTGRGVVATASYEARKFGVHSAMATRIARRLCPKGVFTPPRMDRYKEISRGVFEIYQRATPLVEKISIDEAYLDVTAQAPTAEDAEGVARQIKAEIRAQHGLTISVGVAPCKFVAKISSDLDKPDGLVIVRPDEVVPFLAPLPVGKIPGVGKVTEAKLHRLEIRTIGQLAEIPRSTLEKWFGKFGAQLHEFARGIDSRAVVVERQAKSLGSENTFERDHVKMEPLLEALRGHAEDVALRLDRLDVSAHAVTLKIRYGDFQSITRTRSLDAAIHDALDLYETASSLLPKTEAGRRPVRLIGLYAAGLVARAAAPALDFFGERQT